MTPRYLNAFIPTLEWANPPVSGKYRGPWHGGVNSHLIITAINDRIMATRDDDDGRGDYNRAEGADITCLHVVAVWWESQLSAPHFFFFSFSSRGLHFSFLCYWLHTSPPHNYHLLNHQPHCHLAFHWNSQLVCLSKCTHTHLFVCCVTSEWETIRC